MLYVATRNNRDAYTAHNALINDYAACGGVFVPFRLPRVSSDDLLRFKENALTETVAEILNVFFSLKITGRDLELEIGKNLIKIVSMSHRIVVAELWHNVAGSFQCTEDALLRKLAKEVSSPISQSWAKIAIRIALLFGLYAHLLHEGVIAPKDTIDISTQNDNFTTPLAIWYARTMGLPIKMNICTCNDDNNLWDFIHRGALNTAMLSGTMQDNLERFIYVTEGPDGALKFTECCKKKKSYVVSAENIPQINSGLYCSVAGKDRAATVINSLYRSNAYIADPGAALSYGGIQDYRAKTGDSGLTVIIAEETPLNFVTDISAATGLDTQSIRKHIK